MPPPKDSGHIELRAIFRHTQRQMLACFAAGELFEHPGSCGAATERQWIELFNRFLPQRYQASSAFVIDADGRRSRQIDIAVYDRFYSPLLFPHESGLHIPAESVYAVFEVKQILTRQLLRDAARKAASVRRLRRTSAPIPFTGGCHPAKTLHPILPGILAARSVWSNTFHEKISTLLRQMPPEERLDLGCSLEQGSFELTQTTASPRIKFSSPDEALIFFMIRLAERLRAMGTAPAVDLMEYPRSLPDFSPK